MKMSSDSFHMKTEIESVWEMPCFNRERSGEMGGVEISNVKVWIQLSRNNFAVRPV
jgi:hypothetical protein